MVPVRVSFSVYCPQSPFGGSFEVRVSGSSRELGAWNLLSSLPLKKDGNGRWVGMIELSPAPAASSKILKLFEFKYLSCRLGANPESGNCEWEKGANRKLILEGPECLLYDIFRSEETNKMSRAFEKIGLSSAFNEVFYSEGLSSIHLLPVTPETIRIRFRVSAWAVRPGDRVVVVGSTEELGLWDVSKGIVLNEKGDDVVDDECHFPNVEGHMLLRRAEASSGVEYKYVIVPSDATSKVIWESGANRRIQSDFKGPVVLISDEEFRGLDESGYFRASGVIIPVFSLRSHDSLGIGEFSDIRLMVDWSVKCGLRVLQVLPVNDTRSILSGPLAFRNSYPYSPISIRALNPVYANIGEIARSAKFALRLPEDFMERLECKKRSLDLPAVDYPAVVETKLAFLKELFDLSNPYSDDDIKQFVEDNETWLIPYAVFCVLRDTYGHTDYEGWPEEYRHPSMDKVREWAKQSNFEDACHFWYFVQYHLDQQLKDASDYAKRNGIILKGDLPIGVDPHSVDVWMRPSEFRLDTDTGAPPDDFAVVGQNWGFPTYNWKEMEVDDFAWWKERFHGLERYFHAIRIDHVLGLFRIWRIPHGDVPLKGYYYPSVGFHRKELESKGLWDFDRLICAEFSETDLKLIVHGGGDDWRSLAGDLVEEHPAGSGRYRFLPTASLSVLCDRVLRQVPELPETEGVAVREANRDLRKVYRDAANMLWAGFCLVRDLDDKDVFYIRFNVHSATQLKLLPTEQQILLKKMCDDFYQGLRNDVLWRHTGLSRLSMLQSASKMMICAEDLGEVPPCVPPVLDELGMLCLRVQRMPRKDDKLKVMRTSDYPVLSVCAPSTHDTPVMRSWWQKLHDTPVKKDEPLKMAPYYYDRIIGSRRHEASPPFFLEVWLAEDIVRQHLECRSMLAMFLWQDWVSITDAYRRKFPEEETINDPDNPLFYWRYRMHIALDDLLTAKDFISTIRRLLGESRRL